jgi:putative copper export protein
MATPRVSTIAAWSVAALATTGAITAWNEIGWHFDLLVYSLYGRILTYKLATAGAVILVGGYNRYRVMPAFGEPSAHQALIRNVTSECILLAAVLAWSALLANSPPPH